MAKKEVGAEVTATPIYDKSVDYSLGAMRIPHQNPEIVGTITAQEAGEIKRRNKALERYLADAEHSRATYTMAQNERNAYIRSLGARFNLGPLQEFNVDDDSGQVSITAHIEYVTPDMVQQPEPETPALSVVPDAEDEEPAAPEPTE